MLIAYACKIPKDIFVHIVGERSGSTEFVVDRRVEGERLIHHLQNLAEKYEHLVILYIKHVIELTFDFRSAWTWKDV